MKLNFHEARCMWRRNDFNSKRLNDGVTWQMYLQQMSLFVFIYPTGLIRVCKIRFVSTGENRGKPCLIRKKLNEFNGCEVRNDA